MDYDLIRLGAYANDGTGDDLRTAFDKVNKNFQKISGNVANGTNVGTGIGIFKQLNIVNLEFKSLTSSDSTVEIVGNTSTVDLKSRAKLETDTTPKLGGNLDLNGYLITNGDVLAPIYGFDVPLVAGMLELLIASNQFTIDLGTFLEPAGGNGEPNSGIKLNMGGLAPPFPNNIIDFGTF